MAFSQKGIHYDGRTELKDPVVRRALDDVLSQVQAGQKQVNATSQGTTPAPSAPTFVSVAAGGGFANLAITHVGAAKGTAYLIQYSTTPNFQNPQIIDNGISKTWEKYLAGKTLYFRVAATLYTSPQSGWTYYGTAGNPTPVTF